jgi:hypothetical protein
MRKSRRHPITAGRLALAGLLLFATLGQAAERHALPTFGGEAVAAAPAFKATGHVKRLYPGAKKRLRVTVKSLSPFPIVVTSLAVRRGDPPGRCAAKHLKIAPFKGRARIGAGRTITLKLAVSMKRTAPDACQGARWRLGFHGKAVRG